MAPQTATHAAAPHTAAATLGLAARPHGAVPRLAQRALDPRSWAQVRGFADVVVLCLASSAALFGTPGLDQTWTDRWLAAIFPLAVASLLYARRTPDERLNGTLLDIGAHVLGVVSLAAMLSIALESIGGAARPLELAHPPVAVRGRLPRHLPGDALLDPPSGAALRGRRDAHADRRRRRDRHPPGQAPGRRATLRPAARRIPGCQIPCRAAIRDDAGHCRCSAAPRIWPTRSPHRRAARDPGLLGRARPRPGGQGPRVRGAGHRGLARPPALRVDQRAHDPRPRRAACRC